MGNQEAKMSTRVDLLKSSQNLYDFLREVDANPALYSLLVLKNAVQRYETFWLPLMAEQGDVFLPAPLDIEYVWCCHMLSPYAYMKDCQLIAGKVVDHVPHSCYAREQLLITSRQLWTAKYAGVSFEVDLTNVNPAVDDSFVSKCSYDIVSAALRQRSFNYNSSLPHFRDEKFLAKAIRRYATMLMIIRDNPGHPVVPCYDNDLVWHAHQLYPATYNHDTTGFLGAMLNHDDDRCDRSPGSQLSKSMADTRALWKARRKPFGTPGGMYRGDPPAVHYSVPTRRELLHNKMYKLRLQKLQLRNFPTDCDQRLVSMIRIFIVNRNFTVTKIWSSQLQPLGDTFVHSFLTKGRECEFDFDPTNSCALRVSLTGGKHVAFQVDLPLTSYTEVSDSIPDIIRFAMNIRCDAMGVLDGEMHLLCDQIADFSFTVKSPPGKVLTANHLRDVVHSVGLMAPASLFMQTARCQYSDHQVSDHLRISSFTWRIVHCKRPALSAIEVLDNCGHVVSTGHTIGSQSLPRRKQVRNRSLALCHDPLFERAILIRSSSSDWGILKASWHGFVKPQAGVSGSAGQLKLSLFVLKGADSSFATIGQSPAAPYLFTWGTPHGECSVDFQSGRIRFLGSVSCVAENICLAGAIALAFVLCQPRPRPGKTPSDSAGLGPIHGRNSARSDVLDGNTMPLLVAGGLYSNSIPLWYHADTHGDRFYQILPDYIDKIVGDLTYDYDNGDMAYLDDGDGLPRSRAEVGGWDVPLATVSSAIHTRSRSRSGRGKVRTKAKAYGGDFYGGGGGCGSGDGFGGGACGNLDGGGGGACGGGGCGSGDGGGGGACGGGGCGGGGS